MIHRLIPFLSVQGAYDHSDLFHSHFGCSWAAGRLNLLKQRSQEKNAPNIFLADGFRHESPAIAYAINERLDPSEQNEDQNDRE
jgi:hypothetical protein